MVMGYGFRRGILSGCWTGRALSNHLVCRGIFEATGSILRMLLHCIFPNTPHHGRTLLHHAILCDNMEAVKVLVKCGADIETPITTTQQIEFRPIHMAARLERSTILETLIDYGCELNSTTKSGDTALMISIRYKLEECLQALAKARADFGIVNLAAQSVTSVSVSSRWYLGFQQALLNVVRSGTVSISTNVSVFSPLLFVAYSGDVVGLKAVLGHADIELDKQDEGGFSAVMVTAMEGHVDAFRMPVYAGADVKLCNKSGESAITLSKLGKTALSIVRKHGKGHNELAENVLVNAVARKQVLDGSRVLILDPWGQGSQKRWSIVMNLRPGFGN
ncbi:hypothetical protein ACS0TY_015365 [Phlomoides rotata]